MPKVVIRPKNSLETVYTDDLKTRAIHVVETGDGSRGLITYSDGFYVVLWFHELTNGNFSRTTHFSKSLKDLIEKIINEGGEVWSTGISSRPEQELGNLLQEIWGNNE